MNERQRLWTGSVLVLLQFGLLAVLALLAWPAVEHGAIPLAGWAFTANRPGNFNIHPSPRVGGTLVTSGPDAWIRHPMYTSLLLGALALARTADSETAWLAWVALLFGSSQSWKSAGCWRNIRGMRITASKRSGFCRGSIEQRKPRPLRHQKRL